ncbi:hypothetical protein AMTRI_Chr04g247010 [Amborella trichopoda]
MREKTLCQRDNTPLLPYSLVRPHSHPSPYPIILHTPYLFILHTHPYSIPTKLHTYPYSTSIHTPYLLYTPYLPILPYLNHSLGSIVRCTLVEIDLLVSQPQDLPGYLSHKSSTFSHCCRYCLLGEVMSKGRHIFEWSSHPLAYLAYLT